MKSYTETNYITRLFDSREYKGRLRAMSVEGAPDFAVVDWRKPQLLTDPPDCPYYKLRDRNLPYGLLLKASGFTVCELDSYEACASLAQSLQGESIDWRSDSEDEFKIVGESDRSRVRQTVFAAKAEAMKRAEAEAERKRQAAKEKRERKRLND